MAQVETDAALHRIEGGRFRPKSPVELSYAITSGVARRQRGVIAQVAEKLPGLEAHVMSSQLRDPEVLLETMFLIRHELITARTTAAQCHEVWMRMASIGRVIDDEHAPSIRDLADQFDRVRSLADGEAQFLFGVIELYQTKVNTKMTVAMERLAVIAAVTLPVTAIASVYGMNVIVNDETHYTQLGLALAVMAGDQPDLAALGAPPGLVVMDRLTRVPELGVTDRQALDQLLDSQWVGTLATVVDGEPWAVPMLFARDGDRVLIHGSTGAGVLRRVAAGSPAVFIVFALDSLVVAPTTFESSVNYRSAMIRGRLESATDPEKTRMLDRLAETLIPGRTTEVRPSSRKELAATLAMALPIADDNWLLKVADEWPATPEQSGAADDVWSGLVPVRTVFDSPVPAPWSVDLPVPESVRRLGEPGS